jgi:hypothetical protein
MPDPEIARRCHACGASIRDRAFFCPQCGISMDPNWQTENVNEQADTVALSSDQVEILRRMAEEKSEGSPRETAPGDTVPLNPHNTLAQRASGNAPELAETQPLNSEQLDPAVRQMVDDNSESSAQQPWAGDTVPLHPIPPVPQRPAGRPPNYGTRPAQMKQGRALKDGRVVQKVEKLRKISTVVIDQATYDPSLRFILVAGFLFLIFLIIVIMNRFIG